MTQYLLTYQCGCHGLVNVDAPGIEIQLAALRCRACPDCVHKHNSGGRHWQDLLVTRTQFIERTMPDGESWPLVDVLRDHPEFMEDMFLDEFDGIGEWMCYCVHFPGEVPDSDTPRDQVDWNGFLDAWAEATSREDTAREQAEIEAAGGLA